MMKAQSDSHLRQEEVNHNKEGSHPVQEKTWTAEEEKNGWGKAAHAPRPGNLVKKIRKRLHPCIGRRPPGRKRMIHISLKLAIKEEGKQSVQGQENTSDSWGGTVSISNAKCPYRKRRAEKNAPASCSQEVKKAHSWHLEKGPSPSSSRGKNGIVDSERIGYSLRKNHSDVECERSRGVGQFEKGRRIRSDEDQLLKKTSIYWPMELPPQQGKVQAYSLLGIEMTEEPAPSPNRVFVQRIGKGEMREFRRDDDPSERRT